LGPPGDRDAWLPSGDISLESWCLLPSPLTLDSSRDWITWRRGLIPQLAGAIYEHERFNSLFELAEVLEEAGCTDSSILDHVRGPSRHLRGCWVLDLLRGLGSARLD